MHARSHLITSDKPDRIKAVYGFPVTTNFIEIMLLWPLFHRIRSQNYPLIAYRYETFRGGLARKANEFTSWKNLICLWFVLLSRPEIS